MKKIIIFLKSIKLNIKNIKLKHVLAILGITCLMIAGTFTGLVIHGVLGGSFGMILGYVVGRSLFTHVLNVDKKKLNVNKFNK
ncbi:MAG: hypothetical protein KR126chlam4_01059 [Candidatus Anoxychlamydiales bacterium]|nr:hypothetical protein [Candidatus Anoxychlamydiales bacterium]